MRALRLESRFSERLRISYVCWSTEPKFAFICRSKIARASRDEVGITPKGFVVDTFNEGRCAYLAAKPLVFKTATTHNGVGGVYGCFTSGSHPAEHELCVLQFKNSEFHRKLRPQSGRIWTPPPPIPGTTVSSGWDPLVKTYGRRSKLLKV